VNDLRWKVARYRHDGDPAADTGDSGDRGGIRTVPYNRPLRPDGEPNRPLTIFSVAFW
jgi:hypothetical protein